jgi:activator of HSP90 ATPase
MSTPIHQEVTIQAGADRVYAALLDSQQFSKVTGGAPASIEAVSGGAFSCFGGAIEGRNIELVPGKRIVQAWRVSVGSSKWDDGVYSIVKFELTESEGVTKLILDQDGFPEDTRPHLESGWHKMYWEPLAKYLA